MPRMDLLSDKIATTIPLDAVHPNLYPAGKLWGDMMLYNLKQHVEASESYRKLKRRPPPHAR